MSIHFLTSGWPNGYTDSFIQQLKNCLPHPRSFVYVASDFAGYEKSDFFFHLSLSEFQKHGIAFEQSAIVDFRRTSQESMELIRHSDLVMLAGGPTLKQMEHIHQYQLEDAMQSRNGVTMGISAGSINMANRVVLAKDESDDIPELSIYPGIGLVDINIEPHLDELTPRHLKEIREAARIAPIYGLYDESFIVVNNGDTSVFGKSCIFNEK